jgi:hypothetical protein
LGVGVFHLIDDALVGRARGHLGLVRRLQGMAGAVAEPDGVAVAEHDVIGAGAAVHRLVEVVAHRELIHQAGEIGGIALLHVVETEGGGTLPGGLQAGRASGIRREWLRVQLMVGQLTELLLRGRCGYA